MPITVAVAGRSETISEYVARLRRAMASWSNTHGITEEATANQTPAARRPRTRGTAHAHPGREPDRIEQRGRAAGAADRGHEHDRHEHRRGEAVDPRQLAATR